MRQLSRTLAIAGGIVGALLLVFAWVFGWFEFARWITSDTEGHLLQWDTAVIALGGALLPIILAAAYLLAKD